MASAPAGVRRKELRGRTAALVAADPATSTTESVIAEEMPAARHLPKKRRGLGENGAAITLGAEAGIVNGTGMMAAIAGMGIASHVSATTRSLVGAPASSGIRAGKRTARDGASARLAPAKAPGTGLP